MFCAFGTFRDMAGEGEDKAQASSYQIWIPLPRHLSSWSSNSHTPSYPRRCPRSTGWGSFSLLSALLFYGRSPRAVKRLGSATSMQESYWLQLRGSYPRHNSRDLPWDFVGIGWFHATGLNSTPGAGSARSTHNRIVSGTDLVTAR